MFNKFKSWMNSPEGIVTTCVLYGAALVGLFWMDDKRESRRVSRAFEEGMRTGFNLSERGLKRSDVMLMQSGNDIYSRTLIVPKKAPEEAEKHVDGAKTEDSCTISSEDATSNTTMVQNDDSVKEE